MAESRSFIGLENIISALLPRAWNQNCAQALLYNNCDNIAGDAETVNSRLSPYTENFSWAPARPNLS